jgi:TolB-like protein/DNA-binding winged helix-turn-helix (wHTH) protein/Tfp pilus assembly protein PilF
MPLTREVVRFGAFELNLRSGELRKHGIRLKLQDQPLQVLTMLLEKRGEVVTRDELRQKLWSDDTFVDFDAGLNSAVKKLRNALGDSAENHSYIETLPRRGYRFIGEVESEPGAAEPSAIPKVASAETAGKPSQVPGRRSLPVIVFAGASLVVLVGLGVGLNVGDWRYRLFDFNRPPQIRTMAVLPLVNLTGDASEDYFVDGMTDALTTNLAQIRALRVISRTTAMQYKGEKGQNRSMDQIGKELNVDAVVEGSVVRSGDRVRINAQLIHVPSDQHLWAKSYEADIRDIVVLQNEMARAIAEAVRITVTPQEKARWASKRTVSPEAYEAYVRGRFFWNKRNPEGFKRAIEYFQQAIVLEADYAEAYSGLSDSYRMAQHFDPIAPGEAWPKAKAAAEKALELDDSLAEAHTSLAVYLWRHDWDWTRSEAEFRRAIELNPNYAEAHRTYAVFLRTIGRFEEALAEYKLALEPERLSVVVLADAGQLYYWWRDYPSAIEYHLKALELDANFAQAHYGLGRIYLEMGDFTKAISSMENAVRLSDGNTAYVARLGYTFARSGKPDRAREILEALTHPVATRYVSPYCLAVLCTGLGQTDQAFAHFEQAFRDRSFELPLLNIDPQVDALRSDPRFSDLVRRMGLTPMSSAEASRLAASRKRKK